MHLREDFARLYLAAGRPYQGKTDAEVVTANAKPTGEGGVTSSASTVPWPVAANKMGVCILTLE